MIDFPDNQIQNERYQANLHRVQVRIELNRKDILHAKLGKLYTVNVEICTQYIFSCISRRALDAPKFDVCENYNHDRTNRIKWYVRENLTT